MEHIKIYKKFSFEKLEELDFLADGVADWVELVIGDEHHETNRYDMIFEDELRIYVYFDESLETIIAIDGICEHIRYNERYLTKETPIFNTLKKVNLL